MNAVKTTERLVENGNKRVAEAKGKMADAAVTKPSQAESRTRAVAASPNDIPDEKFVVLRVRDCGAGIPQHELKRIFKRFYRVAQRSNAKGTGLGLFIVRAIARKHGGNVFAESEGPGKGTTVTLELPRRMA
jgi:signal transduction histidine kinase